MINNSLCPFFCFFLYYLSFFSFLFFFQTLRYLWMSSSLFYCLLFNQKKSKVVATLCKQSLNLYKVFFVSSNLFILAFPNPLFLCIFQLFFVQSKITFLAYNNNNLFVLLIYLFLCLRNFPC